MSGVVVWITGIPSSGKSTLAATLSERLRACGRAVCALDGDEIRSVLAPAAGYEADARKGFYTMLAQLAALLARQQLVVLVPATAHLREFRQFARSIAPQYVEVFVRASRDEAFRRDDKGLYAAAQRGDVQQLPGVDVEYEPPSAPDFVAEGGRDAAAATVIVDEIMRRTGGPRSG
jgi:adenylylsulfate kinase